MKYGIEGEIARHRDAGQLQRTAQRPGAHDGIADLVPRQPTRVVDDGRRQPPRRPAHRRKEERRGKKGPANRQAAFKVQSLAATGGPARAVVQEGAGRTAKQDAAGPVGVKAHRRAAKQRRIGGERERERGLVDHHAHRGGNRGQAGRRCEGRLFDECLRGSPGRLDAGPPRRPTPGRRPAPRESRPCWPC